VVETKEITLSGHTGQTVTFTTSLANAGIYSVDVNGLTGILIMKEASPTPIPTTTPTPTQTPVITPTPTPTPTQTPAITPTPIPTQTPTPTPAPPPFNWYLGGGIIMAVILISLAVWLTVYRRRG